MSSLMHRIDYTDDYTLEDDQEGLEFLLWSQFMCKCGGCDIRSGKRYMERLPVLILDDIIKDEKLRINVAMGYVCKPYADLISLPTRDSHRVGLSVKVRLIDPKKRIKLIRGLILRGVTRYKVDRQNVYFDTDDLKQAEFVVL